MDTEKKKALGEVLRSIPPEAATRLSQIIPDLVNQIVCDSLQKTLPAFLEEFQNALGVTDEVGTLALRLSREHRMSPSEFLLKAMALFKLALDAKSEGNRVAVLDQENEIVQEIVGLEPSGALLQPA